MYRPPHFREDRLEAQHAVMRAHTLALLIVEGPDGLLADPVPFLLDPEGGEFGVLRAHVARANPQVQALAAAEECLVVFQGPGAYVSPTWYATKGETHRVVPTWNYAVVQAFGHPRLVEDPAWLRAQIDGLTALQESRLPQPWRVDDAPAEFIRAQLKGIVGVEIPIGRIEGKLKASQNRSDADRAGVAEGLRAMADVIEEHGGPVR